MARASHLRLRRRSPDNDAVTHQPTLSHFQTHTNEDLCAAIIIIEEADYCIPLMGSAPFPPFKPRRMSQETQLYRSNQDYRPLGNWHWQRHYMGSYTPKEPPTKKRPAPMTLATGADGHESEPRLKRTAASKSGRERSYS